MLSSLIMLFFSGAASSIDSSACINASQQDVGSLVQLGKGYKSNTSWLPFSDWQMCGLPCSTGSCSNYLIQAETMEKCNEISQSNNCGSCKSASAVEADPMLLQYVQAFGSQLEGTTFVTFCGAKPSQCPANIATDYHATEWSASHQCMPCGFYVSCQMGCETGSCGNYLIAADSPGDCNMISQAMGCGACKASIPASMKAMAQQVGANFATVCNDPKKPDFTYPPGNSDSNYNDFNFRIACSSLMPCAGYDTLTRWKDPHDGHKTYGIYECCPGLSEEIEATDEGFCQ